ncbi:hypothetical protein Rhopal_001167-T1 [Rhodotorula paludigena]|uniref:Uncharacterized protein n=1 Tax=Rhodotorula paludigena TaxID=86838 RepID=A0AAV5GFS6_9BASI|nr:hypothetical protein Rhopal_001167-T1 [Rhodotorula paludigena]
MASSNTSTTLHPLLGLAPSDPALVAFLASLSSPPAPPPEPQVKAYPDVLFLNYRPLALSLSFAPRTPLPSSTAAASSLADLLDPAHPAHASLACTQIDIYNHAATPDAAPAPPKARTKPSERWGQFPRFPLALSSSSSSAADPVLLEPSTTGAALLSLLGEPARKGGGQSATPALGIWTEWTSRGVLVEWASQGLEAWEKGGEARWRCVSVFAPEEGDAEGADKGA